MAKHALVEQPTPAPTAKVLAAGLAGIAATAVLSFADLASVVDLPTFWDSALTFAAAFAAGYLKRERASARPR